MARIGRRYHPAPFRFCLLILRPTTLTKEDIAMAEAGIFEIMYSMRAMRRLKPDPIPEETLKKIVDAAIHAPSGGNPENCAFVLTRNAEFKRFIRGQYWGIGENPQGSRGIPTNLQPPRT